MNTGDIILAAVSFFIGVGLALTWIKIQERRLSQTLANPIQEPAEGRKFQEAYLVPPPQKANNTTRQIREWLEERDNGWHGYIVNLNSWHRNNTENLFLYEDVICISKDYNSNNWEEFPIPTTKEALYFILDTYGN